MVSTAVIDASLAQRRLAFVGVSHDPEEFSVGVYRELKSHGYELTPVNPHAEEVDGAVSWSICVVGPLIDRIDELEHELRRLRGSG